MDRKTRTGGMGFVSTLTLIFIVLKCCRLIEWSWWWVLSPVWISALVCLVALLGILSAGRVKKGK